MHCVAQGTAHLHAEALKTDILNVAGNIGKQVYLSFTNFAKLY